MYYYKRLGVCGKASCLYTFPICIISKEGHDYKTERHDYIKIYSGDTMESVEKHLYDTKHMWQCSYKKQYWNHVEWYDTGLCTTH